jgi:hypothetical protein
MFRTKAVAQYAFSSLDPFADNAEGMLHAVAGGRPPGRDPERVGARARWCNIAKALEAFDYTAPTTVAGGAPLPRPLLAAIGMKIA